MRYTNSMSQIFWDVIVRSHSQLQLRPLWQNTSEFIIGVVLVILAAGTPVSIGKAPRLAPTCLSVSFLTVPEKVRLGFLGLRAFGNHGQSPDERVGHDPISKKPTDLTHCRYELTGRLQVHGFVARLVDAPTQKCRSSRFPTLWRSQFHNPNESNE